ncbi:MAG: selenocysteine-specific translation elongation factor [Henriciella sp.]|nr:selenocysteine-specific translation elongation factor [Henriciella sp.]
MHKTIAVIGHVDHGKTALVKALTGVEMDTLAEERARGLTITLGFAHRETERGWLHFIDAPGHSDFVRTTAAGLSGVDGVLLAVSCTDGIQAQTREHLRLAHCLGIRQIIVALTKADLAADVVVVRTRAEIESELNAYSIEPVAIVASSSLTGKGSDSLGQALERFLDLPQHRVRLPGFYLPVDRVFTAPGVGTVVTGTLIGGEIAREDAAAIAPNGPATSVRSLQVAGTDQTSATPGSRVAVNLRGLETSALRKGSVVYAPNAGFEPSNRFDVALDAADKDGLHLKHMDEVMVMLGTAYEPARVRFHTPDVAAGETVLAQLAFNRPQVGYTGQRLVLRNPAAAQIICGGAIIDSVASPGRRNKDAHQAVLRAALEGAPDAIANALADRDKGVVSLPELARLSGLNPDQITPLLKASFELGKAGLALRTSDIERTCKAFLTALAAQHEARPLRPHHPIDAFRTALGRLPKALVEQAERRLLDAGQVIADETGVALASHDPLAHITQEQAAALADLEQQLQTLALRPGSRLDPKSTSPEQDDMIELLMATGKVIRLYNHALNQQVLLHVSAIQLARETLQQAFPGNAHFTTGEARSALKTNRKIIVPLLEFLDAEGTTKREGDVRYITG